MFFVLCILREFLRDPFGKSWNASIFFDFSPVKITGKNSMFSFVYKPNFNSRAGCSITRFYVFRVFTYFACKRFRFGVNRIFTYLKKRFKMYGIKPNLCTYCFSYCIGRTELHTIGILKYFTANRVEPWTRRRFVYPAMSGLVMDTFNMYPYYRYVFWTVYSYRFVYMFLVKMDINRTPVLLA